MALCWRVEYAGGLLGVLSMLLSFFNHPGVCGAWITLGEWCV